MNLKHGMSGTKEYQAWLNIKNRCFSKDNKRYQEYGGRGITVCNEWLESFDNFISDMGKMPDSNTVWSIERLDVNGNYCKENCQWINMALQSRNKRQPRNNTSGYTGVALDSGRYKARWYDLEKNLHSKSFAISKYGEQEAFRLACEYRDMKIKELNLLGAGYGENHGK